MPPEHKQRYAVHVPAPREKWNPRLTPEQVRYARTAGQNFKLKHVQNFPTNSAPLILLVHVSGAISKDSRDFTSPLQQQKIYYGWQGSATGPTTSNWDLVEYSCTPGLSLLLCVSHAEQAQQATLYK